MALLCNARNISALPVLPPVLIEVRGNMYIGGLPVTCIIQVKGKVTSCLPVTCIIIFFRFLAVKTFNFFQSSRLQPCKYFDHIGWWSYC